jgi:hypothetical protein
MKIRQWLGYNEDASQYLLRPGELRILNNLQARRPGMLIARKGLVKVYGKYDNEAIYSLYRRATPLGNPSDFLWFQKVLVARDLTAEQVEAQESPVEYVWMLRRLQGYQSRIIDTLPLVPVDGGTAVVNVCVAEDRHGRMFLTYGHGQRPRIYRPFDLANVALDMGLNAPTSSPSVIASGSGYFIEGVDVKHGGGAYYEPPALTLTGGTPDRHAKLKAIVQAGNVVGVDVVDGGLNYKSIPKIEVASDKIGSGFRARGNISGSARTVSGFSETDSASVSNAGNVPTATQTYGTTNGTASNRVMYLSRPAPVTTKLISGGGATLTLDSTAGIAVGDVVTSYPSAAPFSSGPVTVTEVNTSAGTVTVSVGTFLAVAGTAYEMSFARQGTVGSVAAEYDADRRRFTATLPILSSSPSGKGAHATLEFSPTPLGYGLNSSTNTSIAVSSSNWQTYTTRTKTLAPFLYDEYWTGSDFDVKSSTENFDYGGLQACGCGLVRGFSGSIAGRRADVYWPDYSKLSVYWNTGVYTESRSQWQREDVAIETEVDANTGVTSKVLRFRLKPTKKAKTTTRVAGSTITTGYSAYEELPEPVAPEVKIYLRECPDSWLVDGDQCLPRQQKEAQPNRLAWFSTSSGVPRPIVDIRLSSTDSIDADLVTITDPGRGWEAGTVFAFRLYQANAYFQHVDYNTAVVEDTVEVRHPGNPNKYVEFKFTADTPDNLTPHGPPNTLIAPAQVSLPGDGYSVGETGQITLYKRAVTAGADTAVPAQTLSWTAKTLDTLSAQNTGSIASITILNKGRNYLAEPTIEVRGGGDGYGLSVIPTVQGGRIESVQIVDPGASYTSAPELFTGARAAQLTPIMRPAMRGTYRCAYRYADRSETVIGTVQVRLGESATTLTITQNNGLTLEAGMMLEAAALPFYSRIKSVTLNQVELNQEIVALAADTVITATVRDMTKPIAYSDLSPIADIDAGPNESRSHSSELQWSIPGATPPPRADMVELWRTSADQSLVFYRVEAYGLPEPNGITIVGKDTLTDEQLFDPERAHYAALPVVLPNGSVNAYRFGKPRSDMSVGVAFQDRLWMGVSTSGKDTNTLFYSEFDEFESLPDVNELPIQNNQKSTDVLTALVPFGSLLLAMQHSHAYAVAYNTDPAVDATIQMMAHRGCLHQRAWDIHENVLYAADESGIYTLSRNGEVKDISLPVRDFFVSELLNYSKRETFFLQVDPRTHILRFFCTLQEQSTDTPSIALCFDIQAGTWWSESYPNSFVSACTGRPGDTRVTTILLGGVDGNLYEIDSHEDHANATLTDCLVQHGGSGYRSAPQITVPNCTGAVVQGVVSEGRLCDIVIHSSGWNAEWGVGLLAENDAPLLAHDGRTLQGVEYYPIKLDIGPPDPGGMQATAYANFSVTPQVKRLCNVTLGQSFVRLKPNRLGAFEPAEYQVLDAEDGSTLLAEGTAPDGTVLEGREMRLEPRPVQVGMEAIGDYIPLNSFVSRIDGPDIYLEHPDGTPVEMLFGAVRTNEPGTPDTFLENGGTDLIVRFIKPAHTHIPFRMATGFMQLINDSNAKGGENLIDRSVTLVYTPTDGAKEVEIIERFNGRDEMRANIARRSRTGPGGFVHRQDSASTVLDMSRNASALGFATGVAKATFASRAYADMGGADQHLQVELYGRPERSDQRERENFWNDDLSVRLPYPFVMHSLTVNGVIEDGE